MLSLPSSSLPAHDSISSYVAPKSVIDPFLPHFGDGGPSGPPAKTLESPVCWAYGEDYPPWPTGAGARCPGTPFCEPCSTSASSASTNGTCIVTARDRT